MQAAKLLNNTTIISNYGCSCNFLNLSSIYAQSLRWKRKPIWLPPAKTKLYRVSVRPKIPEDEFLQLQKLYNNYRTYYHSLRKHFLEVKKQNEIELDQSVLDKEEETDYNNSMKINEEWNKQIAAEREIRLAKEKEEKRLKVLEGIAYKKQKDAEIKAEVDKKIRETIQLEPTFITRDNIDQAIEEALANVVSYNKAIDTNGNWHTEISVLPFEKVKSGKQEINK